MPPPRRDRVSILLVDDQPAKLLTYQTILAELDEDILIANSATEALQCLLRTDVAVVLLDVCMPDLDGYELAAMIRQHPRFQQTALIFVSAVLMTDFDRLRGYELGAVDYVPVPVVPAILRAKVSVFADLYRKTRALEALNSGLEARVAERTAALAATTTALQEADRRKDEFLAMLAHELRNPLAPIRTAVQLLRHKEFHESQQAMAREIIDRQVAHLVRLIDDLLDVSRINLGVITLHREPVLVGSIVARAVETAHPAIDAARLELSIELPDELLTVDGDETRLVQVVANVLHNAAKFTDPGGQVRIAVTRDRDQAVFAIADTGIGLPPETALRIFGMFTQVHPRASRPHGGLGIGLALVKRLTEMHGGEVSAHSDGPGRGTTVTIRLPIVAAEPPVRPAAPPPEPVRPSKPRRILVADDNIDAADTLSLQLQLGGHEVRTAYDGAEALAIADSFQPDLVLLDLGMPKMDGCETAARIRQYPWGKDATLVALTGWGQLYDRQRAVAAGFEEHLVKPIAESDLLRILASAARGEGEQPGTPQEPE